MTLDDAINALEEHRDLLGGDARVYVNGDDGRPDYIGRLDIRAVRDSESGEVEQAVFIEP